MSSYRCIGRNFEVLTGFIFGAYNGFSLTTLASPCGAVAVR